MKYWMSLTCAAALIAGCADKPPARTASSEIGESNASTSRTETTMERASEPERPIVHTDEPSTAGGAPVAPASGVPNPGETGAAATLPPNAGAAGDGTHYPMKKMDAAEPASADNTRVNKRDTDDRNPTPMDQGTSAADRNITADIRKAVVADGSLSFTAKNVKIITRDGNVVLRGPVKTEAEKASIQAAATRVAGAGRVANQLEIAK